MTTSLTSGFARRETCCQRAVPFLRSITGRDAVAYAPTTELVLLRSVGIDLVRVSCRIGTWIAIVLTE